MRRLIAIALVVAGVALPACAQRGGARGGAVSHGGGFAGRGGGSLSFSAPAFRASSALAGRASFMGTPQFRDSRYAGANLTQRGGGGVYNRRPVNRGDSRYRRPYTPAYGVGLPYGGTGWVSLGYPGYPDPGFYDNSAFASAPPPPSDPGAGYDPQTQEQAQAVPTTAFRPPYTRPSPEPAPEDAITLVFKDGRPPEQIHNYMLTRKTLYVQDEQHRQIPVEDLDLAATQKINKAAGVDFQLPGISR